MKKGILLNCAAFALLLAGTANPTLAQHDPVQPFKGKVGKTIEETEQSWQEKVRAPKDAPNVVWILLDDVGFGATSAFGGLIQTPNFEKLAKQGLRYTNFHTTGICSPTRAALLTGRNAHSVGMGHHADLAIGTPGYNGNIPFEAGTVGEIFKENGYNTFALGKWHGNPPADLTAAGPYNRHPTGRGFEHFYGFLGGSTDQWHPNLVEDNTPIDIEPNVRHLNELMADKAITYIANQKSVNPEKPFFMYFATGAAHSPHHVAPEWSAKYKGKFDGGWDKYREEVYKRQLAAGLIPKNTKLPARQTGIKAWESLSSDEKKLYARFMEVYAGFLTYTDYEIGRITNYLEEIGQLDNTLIFLVVGDNGGSKEGTYTGTVGLGEKQEDNIPFLLSQYDKIGTEFSAPNYPLGWSQATNTPFRYWKSDVNAEGASHTTLIVHYPKGIKEKNGLRNQYSHVIDILPTTIDLVGLNVPKEINGYPQRPFHGTSLAYSLTDAKAPTRHTQQYYELHGGRSIYKDGWKAAVFHPRNTMSEDTKDVNFIADFKRDKWELYNLNEDFNEINDLASKNPEKLESLKKLFDEEAQKYDVYPLKNYRAGLANPIVKEKTVLLGPASVKTKVQIGKVPVTLTATFDTKDKDTQGVIFSNGGLLGGTSLFIKEGKLHYLLNDGVTETVLTSAVPLEIGKNTVRVEFTEGTIKLVLNDGKAVEKAVASKNKYLNSASSDGFSLGKDLNSPVTKSYNGSFAFTGVVKTLVIEQKSEGKVSATGSR